MFISDALGQSYIPCDLCEKVFLNRDEFNAHRYEVHGAIIVCFFIFLIIKKFYMKIFM